MIKDTISKLEARLKNSSALPAASRDEILQLLGTLKQEVTDLSKTQGGGEHIVGFTPPSATAPNRTEPLNEQLRNFVGSVETSHPKSVQILNRISEILADLGI
jgi:hypothetical protein